MIRAVMSFFIIALLFAIGITIFREKTGKEKWQLIKTLAFAIICSVLSGMALLAIVIVF